jgi:hypothetical protein
VLELILIPGNSNASSKSLRFAVCLITPSRFHTAKTYLGHRRFDRLRPHNLSTLRSHEAMGMLRTEEVMMQVSYPLSAGNRHI